MGFKSIHVTERLKVVRRRDEVRGVEEERALNKEK